MNSYVYNSVVIIITLLSCQGCSKSQVQPKLTNDEKRTLTYAFVKSTNKAPEFDIDTIASISRMDPVQLQSFMAEYVATLCYNNDVTALNGVANFANVDQNTFKRLPSAIKEQIFSSYAATWYRHFLNYRENRAIQQLTKYAVGEPQQKPENLHN